ncbi:hypothetical protein LMG24076_04493 [Trinickia soli]|nr:hypothetical protein LMG24076_04493 [Trinickia soli]
MLGLPMFGHVPLLIDPVFADYIEAYGRAALQFAEDPRALPLFARLYWRRNPADRHRHHTRHRQESGLRRGRLTRAAYRWSASYPQL